MLEIQGMRPGDAMDQARNLWTGMLSATTYPDPEQTIGLIANLQFPAIRDQLMADNPRNRRTHGPRPTGPDAQQTAMVPS